MWGEIVNQHTPFPLIAGHRPYTPFLEKNKCIQKNKNSHFSKYYKNALYIFFKAAHVHSLFSLTKQPSIRASERYRERERKVFIYPNFRVSLSHHRRPISKL